MDYKLSKDILCQSVFIFHNFCYGSMQQIKQSMQSYPSAFTFTFTFYISASYHFASFQKYKRLLDLKL